MIVLGFVLLGAGLVVGLLLALADPVLLSRINGEHAEGGSGRHIQVPARDADVIPLASRAGGDRKKPQAA
ncbi:hypothetical protein ACIBO2_22820 [Nonomuraea sp. NPDC050022]|uniref:hypothetical protein n=1 Tax=unclassified Nonomuraea TaxID=2593643 RepID=UPI0033C2CFFC